MSCTEEYTIQNIVRRHSATSPHADSPWASTTCSKLANTRSNWKVGKTQSKSYRRKRTACVTTAPDTSIQLLIADSCDSVPTNRAFARHTGVTRHDNLPSRTAQTLAIPAPSDAQSDETSDAPVCNAPTCTRVHGLNSGAVGVARAKVDGACAVNSTPANSRRADAQMKSSKCTLAVEA